MRAALFLTLAIALVGMSSLAPTAAADIVFSIDRTGDGDCNDHGETIRIPTPGDRIHRHGPCAV